MDTEIFKKEVLPHLDAAIAGNGGIEQVRKTYGMMGESVVSFIAGWVAARVLAARERAETSLKQKEVTLLFSIEETRRIYDLVRLRIDSESSTS